MSKHYGLKHTMSYTLIILFLYFDFSRVTQNAITIYWRKSSYQMQINTEHFLTFTQTNMASQWLSVFWDFSQNSQFVQNSWKRKNRASFWELALLILSVFCEFCNFRNCKQKLTWARYLLSKKRAKWKKMSSPISRSVLSSVDHLILFSFLFFVYKFANL